MEIGKFENISDEQIVSYSTISFCVSLLVSGPAETICQPLGRRGGEEDSSSLLGEERCQPGYLLS